MTPELQTVVDRLELVERQNRSLRGLSVVALLAAVGAATLAWMGTRPGATPANFRASSIETNRLLLRDLDGRTAGGLEVDRAGTVRLVLGAADGRSGAAFLEVRRDSLADLTLRGPDGGVRVALIGTRLPALLLAPEGSRPTVSLQTSPTGTGSLMLADEAGRLRFRAP